MLLTIVVFEYGSIPFHLPLGREINLFITSKCNRVFIPYHYGHSGMFAFNHRIATPDRHIAEHITEPWLFSAFAWLYIHPLIYGIVLLVRVVKIWLQGFDCLLSPGDSLVNAIGQITWCHSPNLVKFKTPFAKALTSDVKLSRVYGIGDFFGCACTL